MMASMPDNLSHPVTFRHSDRLTFAIDFGTSNSLLAVTDGEVSVGPLELDPLSSDPSVFRSVLYFPNQDQCFYGQEAVERYSESQAEGRLIRSIKKYLPSQSFLGSWIENRMVRLEDLISIFLLEMKKRAEHKIGHHVDRVLLGRPAQFSENAENDQLALYRLKRAAEIAGFKHIEFLPEPLAAAFDLRRRLKQSQTVLVVDLGGGTSDFTVIRIGPHEFSSSDVLAMGGISIAGDAVDGEFMKTQISPLFGANVLYRVPMSKNILQMPKSLLDHICSPADIAQLKRNDYFEFFKSVEKWALHDDDKKRLHRLHVLVEDQLGFELFEHIDQTKRELGVSEAAKFKFDYPEIEIEREITRRQLNRAIDPAIVKILATLDRVVADSGLSFDKIDLVYCTGGTSKLLSVQEALRTRFSNEKIIETNFFHSVIEGLLARAKELVSGVAANHTA